MMIECGFPAEADHDSCLIASKVPGESDHQEIVGMLIQYPRPSLRGVTGRRIRACH
jgi:hypothetical protein